MKRDLKYKVRRGLVGAVLIGITIFSVDLLIKSFDSTKTSNIDKTPIEKKQKEIVPDKIKYENELKEVNKHEQIEIQKAISSIYGKNTNNVGIYYKNLITNMTVELNPNKYFIAASTIKVPLVMKVADLIHNNKAKSTDTIMVTKRCIESGTGILQNRPEELKAPINIKRLMKLAIIYSDNIATNMLYIKYKGIDDYVYDVTGVHRKTGNNYMTPALQGKILEHLYKNPSQNPIYDEIKEWLKDTEFHDRLDKYIPYNKVAHKVGNMEEYIHDTGLIYTKTPYVLTIYTKNSTAEKIALVSKKIYDINCKYENKILELNKKII